jgi:membrane protease YdiL (CAAX protease family)
MPMPSPEQALDIQHDTDPAPDFGPARRVPHLGHAALFFSITLLVYLTLAAAVLTATHIRTEEQAMQHFGLQLFIQVLAYVLSLAFSAWVFAKLWSKPFLLGIEWNALATKRRWFIILPLGILLSIAAQLLDAHLPQPPRLPIQDLFNTPAHAWMLTIFGVLLVPVFEEIAFRGFLLPAFATAYDWLALDRTPAGLRTWESSTAHTTPALIFGAVFSSIAFALIHGGQLSYSWGLLSVLFAVSLCFSWVRIRFHSVSASVLMHATYNLATFVTALYVTGFYRHLERMT